MLRIDLETARRYILGKQGLWPGRRWQGIQGTEQAMREMEYLQLDPLQIVARSHDITLHSRVIDYGPGLWEGLAYGQQQRPEERRFFDWGGWLAVRPMEELPYWRAIMRLERETSSRLRAMASEHAEAIAEMRAVLRERETVSNRDFEMASRKRTSSYRGRKDSALALYYLWRTGEVMTHHRERFERVYALSENVALGRLLYESSPEDAFRFLMLKDVRFSGLSRLDRAQDSYWRSVSLDNGHLKRLVESMQADGDLIEVQVEGWKQRQFAAGSDEALLNELSAGRVPPAWKPRETSTSEEVTFLAPLDPVSARGRAKVLFGFDYVWEVYKPQAKRKYGYYTLPVLWGDRLVARFDSKLDRKSNTFVILGLWLEDEALGHDDAFAEALARGFARFTAFLGAGSVEAGAVDSPLLRQRVAALCGCGL